MDSINSLKMTASSILSSSNNSEVKEPKAKSVEVNDSFVKNTEVELNTKLDFVKKVSNEHLDAKDVKTFIKDVAFSTGVGALAGCMIGGKLGASPLVATGIGVITGGLTGAIMGRATAVDRAKAKIIDAMPVEQHSVEYQKPVYKTEKVFAGKIPTNYYVRGKHDKKKETPLIDSYLTIQNPILDENGKPKMENVVKNSEGKGTPNVTWHSDSIKIETPTMDYKESIRKKYRYKDSFEQTERVVDGFQHSFSPQTKTEKIGEYKAPVINWTQKIELNEASLKTRDALLGVGLGVSSGVIAGTVLALVPSLFF